MKVLAIGAHYDDVELGCGGTLLKHKSNGDDIYILVVTKSDYKTQNNNHNRLAKTAFIEGRESSEEIGAKLISGDFKTLELVSNKKLINFLINVINEVSPDIVYTHFVGDQHLDHKAVAESCLIAARNVNKVLAYMSNIYDTNPIFEPNYFVDITDYFSKKLKLIDVFESEKESHQNWKKQIEYFNGLYGLKMNSQFVEPFKLIKTKE